MIGGLVCPKKPVLKPRPVPKPSDVPGTQAETSGHMAREPNTTFDIQIMQYRQRKEEYKERYLTEIASFVNTDKTEMKYLRHYNNKHYIRILNEKVNRKLRQYEEDIDIRRKKLSDLLWKEERDYYREVIVDAQAGEEKRLADKTAKLNKIKEEKEAARLKYANDQKLQQYVGRCAEYRPVLVNQRLRESKKIQLLQIEENKSKREAEKELDNFWHEMKVAHTKAMDEREEQDKLRKEQLKNEFLFFTDLQIKEKKMQKELARQEMLRDRERLDQLKRDLDEEERIFNENKLKKKKDLAELFRVQIKEREDMLKRIEEQELQILRAYEKLANEELERENLKIKRNVATGYQDMLMYKQYLADHRKQKEEEERQADKIVEEDLRDIQRKEDEKKCNSILASQAMLQNVLNGRAEQLKEKKKQSEELQKMKDMEIKLRLETTAMNDKLRKEYDHQNFLKEKQYREMLKEQIAYSQVLKDREEANQRKILELGNIENELYEKTLAEILSGKIKICENHPFKKQMDSDKCLCPKPIY